MKKEITKAGPFWAVWDGNDLMGTFVQYCDAVDAAIGWNKRLWNWESLYDVENRSDQEDDHAKF